MSRDIGNAGLELIKSFEGLRLEAYRCPAGKWTIGFGTTSGVYPGMKITKAQAEKMLIADCQKFADAVDNIQNVPLTESLNSNQRDALISFSYNCGTGNLKKLCKGRTLEEIADALLLYNKANGKVLAGLTRRRKAERELFLKPTQSIKQEENFQLKTLKKGSTGKLVKIWQVIIETEPDGIFGDATKKATESFQKKHGLKIDGIVGSESWNAGFESVG